MGYILQANDALQRKKDIQKGTENCEICSSALKARTAIRNSVSEFLMLFPHPTFLLPFAGSLDPTQTSPHLLHPYSTKHIMTTEDQAHMARSFPTLHKHSLKDEALAGLFPVRVTGGTSQSAGEAQPAQYSPSPLKDINPRQAPGGKFTTVSP